MAPRTADTPLSVVRCTIWGMTNPTPPAASGPERRALPGSDRAPIPGAQRIADVAGSDRIQVTLVLRRRAELPSQLPAPLTRAELAERYGASSDDLQLVTDTVAAAGATVVSADAASRRVLVSGSAATLQALFGTELTVLSAPDPNGGTVRFRGRQGELSVPAELHEVVTAVLGLDDRPQARTRTVAPRAAASAVSYSPLDLGRIYRFPAGTDGTGQTIAIVELGAASARPTSMLTSAASVSRGRP